MDEQPVLGERLRDVGGAHRAVDQQDRVVGADGPARRARGPARRGRSATPTRTVVAEPATMVLDAAAGQQPPCPMIETVSATCSTSARMWLDTRTVLPWSASPRMVLRISRMPAGSRPLVGSSKISRSGSLSSVAAIASRCFMPSEYVL